MFLAVVTSCKCTRVRKDYMSSTLWDILDISILDLLENGVETVLRRQVTTSGYIDLPLLPDNHRFGYDFIYNFT